MMRAVLPSVVFAIVVGPPAALPEGSAVMQRVNGRSVGTDARLELRLVLRDDRGEHLREIDMFQKAVKGSYRTLYTVRRPDHLSGVSLLIAEDAARGMWMYFPNSRHLMKVATRGLSALASDFSCEDLKVAFRMEDYEFRTLGREQVNDATTLRIEMVPRSERLARELGYSRSIGWVQEGAWLVVRADYFDLEGQLFKSFAAGAPELRDGVWAVPRYRMTNHRARHVSEVTVVRAEYHLRLPDAQFTPEHFPAARPGESGPEPALPQIVRGVEWP